MKKLLPVFLLVLMACSEEELPQECPDDIACTLQYVTLAVTLIEEGEPVVLSNYEVTNLDNGNKYTFEEVVDSPAEGRYHVVSDSQLKELKTDGTTLRLSGQLAGGGDYSVDFVVGHNCCHVFPISGPFGDSGQ